MYLQVICPPATIFLYLIKYTKICFVWMILETFIYVDVIMANKKLISNMK